MTMAAVRHPSNPRRSVAAYASRHNSGASSAGRCLTHRAKPVAAAARLLESEQFATPCESLQAESPPGACRLLAILGMDQLLPITVRKKYTTNDQNKNNKRRHRHRQTFEHICREASLRETKLAWDPSTGARTKGALKDDHWLAVAPHRLLLNRPESLRNHSRGRMERELGSVRRQTEIWLLRTRGFLSLAPAGRPRFRRWLCTCVELQWALSKRF